MTRMNPRQEPAELLAHGLAAGRQWIVAIAASVSARDRPRGHSLRSFSAIWRFISRNSASAASPRRLCSSGCHVGHLAEPSTTRVLRGDGR